MDAKVIVVGIDFTAASAAALAQALRMAAWNGAQVHPVHIIDALAVAEFESAVAPMMVDLASTLVEDARNAWKNFANDIPGKELLKLDVALANPLAEFRNLCKQKNADLLMLGARGLSRSYGIGTLAAIVVRKVETKVMLVKDEHRGPFKTIVVGIDFSHTSHRALQEAIRVAARDSAAIHVVHVYRAPAQTFSFRPSVKWTDADQARYRSDLVTRLEKFCTPGDPAALTWAAPRYEVIEDKSASNGIINYIKNSGADLAILGSHGLSNIKEVFLGTTVERVVRDAPCSVLSVRRNL